MVRESIKVFLPVELIILASYFYSTTLFINAQVAFLSAFLVIVGSAFAYKKMVQTQVENEGPLEESPLNSKRDLLQSIEDPHELYDEVPLNTAPAEELDLKSIVKEEKAKIKTFSMSSIKHGAKGSVSLFRVLPYIFLVLGFISLVNNEVLDLKFYLPFLLVGIITASIITAKK